jgi:hypothetical protein
MKLRNKYILSANAIENKTRYVAKIYVNTFRLSQAFRNKTRDVAKK